MQRTDYRFTLTRDTDTFEATPIGFFDGNFKYEQQEGQLFFRMKYDGNLIFKGSDYAYFKTRYDLNAYCDLYEILIEKYDGSNYVVFWSGYFSMTDCKFDFEKCQVIVTPVVYDKYSCLLRNSENEINLLEDAPTVLNGAIKTTLEIELIYTTSNDNTPYYQQMYFLNNFTLDAGEYTPGDYVFRVSGREAINIAENVVLGDGWILWDGNDNRTDYRTIINRLEPIEGYNKWVRSASYTTWLPVIFDKPPIVNFTLHYESLTDKENWVNYGQFKTTTGEIYTIGFHNSVFENETYNNNPVLQYRGYSLIESLTKIIKAICTDFDESTITSTFFTNSTNPTTNAASESNNLYLIQNSDAKRPNASNPATKGLLNFKDLMTDLYVYFQVWWYLDDNNNLVIKHQSEIENIPGINITLSPYIKTTAHKKYIEFNKSLIYRYEKWDLNNTDTIDFVGLPIEYDELCSGKEDPRTKTYNGQITTDLGHIQQHQDDVSDEGFTLVAAPGGVIQNRVGLISSRLQANEWLSISRLHNNYWRHNRILRTGKLNGVDTTFISFQKIRKIQEQNIILCEDFDPLKSVTTELGSAIVNEATFFPLDSKLTLNLSI